MIFATSNQYEFKTTSRRDDLMSLCYLLVFLFNKGDVPFVAPSSMSGIKEVFKHISKTKQKITTADLAQGIDETGKFYQFID